jgi:2-methylisocitrate lyase-like PEP mutase family enzyme
MFRSINGLAEKWRGMLESPGPIVMPGCYDVLSATILQSAGFQTVFVSGYGVAASLLGNPDIGLTTLSETTLLTKNIANALNIPIVVDADNGYGNEDNVVRTISELESAGAAAIVMEDQVLPKRCGHAEGKVILPRHLYMRKLECALRARRTPMCLVARTDATDISEGISRARDFHAAGADATIVDGLTSMDNLKRVADEVPGHKQINLIYGGKTPLLPVDELHKLGFKIVLYSTPALYVVQRAMQHWMRVLHEARDLNSISDVSVTFKEFQSFIEASYGARSGIGSKLVG